MIWNAGFWKGSAFPPLISQWRVHRGKAFQVVYHRCSKCHRAWIQSREGPEGTPQSRVSERRREAEVIRLDEEEGGKVPAVQNVPRGTQEERGPSSEVSPPYSQEGLDKPNTPLIRHQVLSRDGQTCATPGCQNRSELFAHHAQWRSNGGRTSLINEVSVCQRCHSLIHEGFLQVEGIAPYGLLWNGRNGKIQDSSELERMHMHGHLASYTICNENFVHITRKNLLLRELL